jgi:diguanylate cyclase (GGDEF)-like protein
MTRERQSSAPKLIRPALGAWSRSTRFLRRTSTHFAGKRYSIRGRLMVLAVIAIAPLVIDRVRDLAADRSERIAIAHQQVRDLAKIGAEKQNEVLATTRAFLEVVARSHATFADASDDCGRFLANLVTSLPWVKAISVSRPDGLIVCSSNPGSLGLDISDRAYFQQALQTGEFVVSEYLFGRRIKGPTIFAGFPQRNASGSVETVAIGALDLSWFGQHAGSLAQRSGSVVLMVDGTGTVAAREPDPDAFVGRNFSDHPLIRALLARAEGTATEAGLDGVRRIYGFTRLPNTQARLAVGLGESEVLQRVNQAMWISFAQLALISGAVLVGIWFGGERWIMRPIRSLAQKVEYLGRGDTAAQAGETAWTSEFVPLAAALDDVAGRIAAREHELRASNGRLEKLSQIDPLTKLANRRAFDARLELEWEHAATIDQPVALLMIDVDHFKLFNDHYGHVRGDACLQRVALVIAGAARANLDLAARYGGEEFALLLPGASQDAAMEVGERLRGAIAESRMTHLTAPLGQVTVSIGVASIQPRPGASARGSSAQVLVEGADCALYAAKNRGRNAVIAHPPASFALAS